MAAPVVPHGTSGTTSPQGIRAWKWRSTAASLPGMEIASDCPIGGAELNQIGAVGLRAIDGDFVLGFGLHNQPCSFFGGSLCASSGHSSSTTARISSEIVIHAFDFEHVFMQALQIGRRRDFYADYAG